MIVVEPLVIGTAPTSGGVLVGGNVGAALDPPAYNPATNYAKDVQVTSAELVYQSAVAGNLGNTPATSPDKWALVGAINKLAMFDRRVGSQTVNPNSITATINVKGVIDLVSFINVDAESITVTQTDALDGLVLTRTQQMTEDVGSWSEYLYAPITRRRVALFTDLLPYRNCTLGITINNAGLDAKCGLCVVGLGMNPGSAQWGGSDGIDDYSVVQKDPFGIRDIVERDYADDAELTIEVRAGGAPRFRRVLASRRAKPTLFVMSKHRPDAQYYGLPSFRHSFPFTGFDYFALSIKGMT